MRSMKLTLIFALAVLLCVSSVSLGINKWTQLPDTSVSGLHSHDYQIDPGGPIFWVKIADDFLCSGGDITKIRWYGNYEGIPEIRGSGIATFHLSLHDCPVLALPWHLPLEPELVPPSVNAPFAQCNETDTGLVNNMNEKIYSYEFTLSTPYPQIAGTWYWLDVMAQSNDPFNFALWRWQEAQRAGAPTGPLGHAPAAERTDSSTWQSIVWPALPPNLPERYSDMAFEIISEEFAVDREYGDAPEGDALNPVIAYPSLLVNGTFPTCKTVGPASSYVEHNNFGAFFGGPITAGGFDFEPDGNGGICASFSPYDNDECWMDGDAGLLKPDPYTIVLGVETPCPNATAMSLGQTCNNATWGTGLVDNIDIEVTNFMPGDTMGYVNVLVDWNQDGKWANDTATQCGGTVVPEHVLVDHPIPNPYVGPLSGTLPPGFMIGPNSGFVWVRFSITNEPVLTNDWNGEGVFEDGETEDYLFHIDPSTSDDVFDWGDAPDSFLAPGYPTLSINSGANHLIVAGAPYLDDGSLSDAPDSEPDGQPDLTATGDDIDIISPVNDDEDGVTISPSPIVAGGSVTISFNVAGAPGCIDAWIDWNQDQVWDDSAGSDEKFPTGAVSCFTVGTGTLNLPVPAAALPGQTFLRIRISSNGGLPPTGPASDGEVEDHEVFVENDGDEQLVLKFQQLPLDNLLIDQTTYWGHDELSSVYTMYDDQIPPQSVDGIYDGCYMADDFADLADTPVIRVKWWGSYLEDELIDEEHVTRFLITFEDDVPADAAQGIPSHPGNVLQSEIVHLGGAIAPLNPGEFSEVTFSSGGAPCYEALYKYEAILKNPFPQEPDKVYWIKIVAMYDIDLNTWQQIQALAIANPGLDLCDVLNLPIDQGFDMPITRWGWHNRDYTIMDTYASSPPAVNPGEHIAGTFTDSSGTDVAVWHFQDDAVYGYLQVDNRDITAPLVFQDPDRWWEQYYKFFLPYCTGPDGVDGPGPSAEHPEGIAEYSKDLAFELWTTPPPPDCIDSSAVSYVDWVAFGRPDCWCYQRQCNADYNGLSAGTTFSGIQWVTVPDLTGLLNTFNVYEPGGVLNSGPGVLSIDGGNGICADFNHVGAGTSFSGIQRVTVPDLTLLLANFNVYEPGGILNSGPGVPVCPLAPVGDIVFYTN